MIIIDVRTPEEFAQGHLKGAILIEYQNILAEIGQYVQSKDDQIGLYCAAGARSGFAAHVLTEQGFTNAINLGAYLHLIEQYPELK